MTGILAQVNISPGGMPKLPVDSARVTYAGLEGDWQKNRKYHGGPDRAICLYSEELYAWLRGNGVELSNGAVGENFTTREIDLQSLFPGDRLQIGECRIQITDVRSPCRQLRKWAAELPDLIVGRSGWMACVLVEGVVRPGDRIEVLRESLIEPSSEKTSSEL